MVRTLEQHPPGGPKASESRRPPCTAQARTGAQCRAWALPGRSTCQTHSPDRADAVRAARVKGQQMQVLNGHRRRLDSPDALIGFLSGLAYDCRDGKVLTDVVARCTYAIATLAKVLEMQQNLELAERVSALEARVGAQPVRGGRWSA